MDVVSEFEWDDAKAESNLAKHGVPFEYAVRLFMDVARIDFDVSRSADDEPRRKVVGMIEERLYSVVYTRRGTITRLISARRTNTKEERFYGPLHT
ncbi:MAG: hypothetical protein JWM33_77 [Caulobacteraceae bacterium]|nr:hypothetical protein [Caulobacteraceae bacterium]